LTKERGWRPQCTFRERQRSCVVAESLRTVLMGAQSLVSGKGCAWLSLIFSHSMPVLPFIKTLFISVRRSIRCLYIANRIIFRCFHWYVMCLGRNTCCEPNLCDYISWSSTSILYTDIDLYANSNEIWILPRFLLCN